MTTTPLVVSLFLFCPPVIARWSVVKELRSTTVKARSVCLLVPPQPQAGTWGKVVSGIGHFRSTGVCPGQSPESLLSEWGVYFSRNVPVKQQQRWSCYVEALQCPKKDLLHAYVLMDKLPGVLQFKAPLQGVLLWTEPWCEMSDVPKKISIKRTVHLKIKK